jgi:WD40 repeat protein
MKILRPMTWLLIAVAAWFPSAGTSARAEDKAEDKVVRLIWFPRFSPDGKWLITAHGSWDGKEGGEVRVWDAESGKPKFVIPVAHGIRSVGWAPKGKFFAAGGYGQVLHIYDAVTGKETAEIRFPASVEVLQISPDEKRVVTAHGNGSVRVTELASKKEVQHWNQVHRGGIWGMRLSSDGKILATAGKDSFVRVYDMETFKVLHELKHPGETNGVAFTKDNKFLFTGCADATIRVFEVATGGEVRTLQGHNPGSITDMQFSPDGKLLASAGIDQTVRLWDLSDFEKPKLKATLQGHSSLVFGVALSPNGKKLASVGWDDQVRMVDVATREELWSWSR